MTEAYAYGGAIIVADLAVAVALARWYFVPGRVAKHRRGGRS